MELPVIAVTEAEAEAKLAEYEAAGPAGRTRLDDLIVRAYRAVRRGGKVIRLSEAIRAGGFDDKGLPRIAVGGATWTEASVFWSGNDLIFTDDPRRLNRGAQVGRHSVRVTLPADARPQRANAWRSGTAMVPLVPPAARPRPRRGGTPHLDRCHVLWEAVWDMTVPYDPALIRRIAGDLWEVLSEWDLTELERAVLAQRR